MAKGKRKYVPGEVLVRLEQLKRNQNLRTDADAFRFMARTSTVVDKDLLGHTLMFFNIKKRRKR